MKRSTIAKTVAAALLALAITVIAADPAAAADELELSSDGVTYAPSIAAPLFPALGQLVPMESRSASFWVKNSTTFGTYLRVSVEGSTWSDPAFASTLTVGAGAPGYPGTAVSVDSTATCRVLLFGVPLDPGEAVEVTVTLALGDLNGSTGQTADVGLDLGVTLTEAAGSATSGCSASTDVPVVGPRGPRQPPTPTITPTATPTAVPGDDGPGALTSGSAPFVIIAELIANTLARFNAGMLGWAAAAVLAGALTYVARGALHARRSGPAEPEISSATTQKDIS